MWNNCSSRCSRPIGMKKLSRSQPVINTIHYQMFKHPHVMCSPPIGIAKLSEVFMNIHLRSMNKQGRGRGKGTYNWPALKSMYPSPPLITNMFLATAFSMALLPGAVSRVEPEAVVVTLPAVPERKMTKEKCASSINSFLWKNLNAYSVVIMFEDDNMRRGIIMLPKYNKTIVARCHLGSMGFVHPRVLCLGWHFPSWGYKTMDPVTACNSCIM